jgi:hypothetical protein
MVIFIFKKKSSIEFLKPFFSVTFWKYFTIKKQAGVVFCVPILHCFWSMFLSTSTFASWQLLMLHCGHFVAFSLIAQGSLIIKFVIYH